MINDSTIVANVSSLLIHKIMAISKKINYQRKYFKLSRLHANDNCNVFVKYAHILVLKSLIFQSMFQCLYRTISQK